MFFFFTVLLSRRVRWSLPFTAVTVLLGTVPFVSFWAEHRATQRVRREQAVAATRASGAVPGDLPGDDKTAGMNR